MYSSRFPATNCPHAGKAIFAESCRVMEAKREGEPYRFGDLLPGAVYVPSFLPREEAEELFQMVKIQ